MYKLACFSGRGGEVLASRASEEVGHVSADSEMTAAMGSKIWNGSLQLDSELPKSWETQGICYC